MKKSKPNKYAQKMLEADLANDTTGIGPKSPYLAMFVSPKRMYAAGYTQTPEERKMNYFDPVDNTPYAWISDKDAVWTGNMQPKTLGETVQHKTLFDIYPELRNMPIDLAEGTIADNMHNTIKGEYANNEIYLANPADVGVALHETQHAIQDKENWFDFKNSSIGKKAERIEDRTQNIGKNIPITAGNVDNLYFAQGHEAQAYEVQRVLDYGIPKEYGAELDMRSALATEKLNPYFLREKPFEQVYKNNKNLSYSDLPDYPEKYKREGIPNTRNVARIPPFVPEDENGGWLEDTVFDKRAAEYLKRVQEYAQQTEGGLRPKKSDRIDTRLKIRPRTATKEEIDELLSVN